MHVVVIGAYGSAGVAVAEDLAPRVGEELDRLTLVDNGEPGGGLCILRGCMPSKEVISAAAHRYQARHDHRLTGEAPAIDLEAVVETKNQHTASFAEHRRSHALGLAERDGVEFLRGTARFADAHTVEVFEAALDDQPEAAGAPVGDGTGAPDRTLDADVVVVATGSALNVPDLPGIDDVDYRGSADVLDATALPDSGVVMGFGYVGLELVPYMAEAGVDLTVIEHDERPLDEAAPAFGDELLSVYREDFGVEVLTETHERAVEPTADGGVRLTCDGPDGERVVEADELFLFTGRRPGLEGLAIDRTPIEPGPGFVRDTMQAKSADHVFLVGDVNGKEPILHVAKEQAFHAADNILRLARGEEPTEFSFTPHHVIFSAVGVYPYARVGHTSETAQDADFDPVVIRREAADDGVFRTKDVPAGLAELVVSRDGTVRGYQGLHYHADVMAKTMQVVVELGLDVRDLPDRAYHPTTPEILDGLFREAAAEVDGS